MAKNVLLSSLGLSPAVVTETIDALQKEGHKMDIVVPLSTSDKRITETYIPLLEADFADSYKGEIELFHYEVEDNDIWTPKDNLDFIKLTSAYLNLYRKRGYDVYVSIAGGRKTMSAALAIVAQLFGARGLYHVLVPEEIEKARLDYELLKKCPEERRKAFHPDPLLMELVAMPFVGLFPYLGQMIKVLRGEATKAETDAAELLKANRLIDESGKPTRDGTSLLEILNYIKVAPEPSTIPPDKKEIRLTSHDYDDREKLETIAQRMRYNPFVNRITSTGWDSKTKQDYRIIGDGEEIFFFIPKTRKGLTLKVFTTAGTRAQAEYVAQLLLPCVNA